MSVANWLSFDDNYYSGWCRNTSALYKLFANIIVILKYKNQIMYAVLDLKS